MTDARLNTRLGNYRILRLIGKGAFDLVYLGQHLVLHTDGAIKVLRPEYAQVDEKVADFYREARIIASLRHRHIVRILDCAKEGELHFFVMDYASSGWLRQYCQRATLLPLSTVVKYIKQTASALQRVHDQGYIHRDVKPENLLLDAHGNILLCDFGIASIVPPSPLRLVTDVRGTIGYISPEQLSRMPCPASDQYSLAIVTYELLVGHCPFQGTSAQIAVQHKNVRPPSLRGARPEIPPAVERVVLKALSKDPHMRFPSTIAFAVALEQAATGKPIASQHHPANVYARPVSTHRLSVDVQSRPVVSQRQSVAKQSEPLRSYQSSNAMHSEPLPLQRRNRPDSPVPLQSREVRRPAPLMDGLVQSARPHYQQKPRSFPVQVLDALELVGRVIAGMFFSVGIGIAMVASGIGHDIALSLSAIILLIMLDILLLKSKAAILVPLVMLALSIEAGILFHSLTFFWLSVAFMCIVIVVSSILHRRN